MLILVLQCAAIVAGLVSAFYWWKSARKPFEVADTLPDSDDSDDGAIAIAVDGKHMIYDFPRQSRMSALGAKWAAASMIAQALTMVLAIVSRAV